jgi:hypothetical protein
MLQTQRSGPCKNAPSVRAWLFLHSVMSDHQGGTRAGLESQKAGSLLATAFLNQSGDWKDLAEVHGTWRCHHTVTLALQVCAWTAEAARLSIKSHETKQSTHDPRAVCQGYVTGKQHRPPRLGRAAPVCVLAGDREALWGRVSAVPGASGAGLTPCGSGKKPVISETAIKKVFPVRENCTARF